MGPSRTCGRTRCFEVVLTSSQQAPGDFQAFARLLRGGPFARYIFGEAVKCALATAMVGMSILAWAHAFLVACIGMVMLTLGLSSSFGTAHIVIQERAPDPIRGRVSAVAGMAFFGALPFALVVTVFADQVGVRNPDEVHNDPRLG